jgi:hypothetical protein
MRETSSFCPMNLAYRKSKEMDDDDDDAGAMMLTVMIIQLHYLFIYMLR